VPSTASTAAQAAVLVLDEVGDAEGVNIRDARLKGALEPLAGTPALEVCCGRCRGRVAWWAPETVGAFIAATQGRAKPRRRHGGISDLAEPAPRTSIGLAPWIELASSGKTSVTIEDWKNPSGWPLRLRFTCRCGAQYTRTNTTRMREYLTAIGSENSMIFLHS